MPINRNRCYACNRGVAFGNNVSHANNKTRRIWKPNLQVVRVVIDGKTQRVKVCARCLHAGKADVVRDDLAIESSRLFDNGRDNTVR